MPSYYEYGIKFDLESAFPCKKEGFVSLRHNHVKMSPLGATLLNEFWKNVWVERQLQ